MLANIWEKEDDKFYEDRNFGIKALKTRANGDKLTPIYTGLGKYYIDLEIDKIYYKADTGRGTKFIEKEAVYANGVAMVYLNRLGEDKKLYNIAKIKELVLQRQDRVNKMIDDIAHLVTA